MVAEVEQHRHPRGDLVKELAVHRWCGHVRLEVKSQRGIPSNSLVVRRLIWGEESECSIHSCSTVKPLGWRMRANDYNSREELERVVIKARHRRWETAEINAELLDLVPCSDDWCDCDWCDLCGYHQDRFTGLDDIPPVPRMTMFDAYKAKRKQ